MISISVIPKDQQRYDTTGDWFVADGTIHVKVADLKNNDYNFLLGIHEMVEAYLCQKSGVTDDVVTAWDKAHPGLEPGDDMAAPYFEQHMFATKVERLVAKRLGVSWKAYGRAVENA